MSETVSQGGRNDLSASLRRLRKQAGLTEAEAARRVGISQAKVSRYEHGLFVPTAEEIEAFTRAYKADPSVRRHLLGIVKDLAQESVSTRVVMHRGTARFQQRIGRIEAASAHVRAFNPAVVIGLLQTAAYARAVFSSPAGTQLNADEIDAAVSARLNRQHLLLENGRRFTLIMSEGALRWQGASPEVMVEQIQHIRDIGDGSALSVGIVPWSTAAHVFPLHGFDMYDRRAVVVGAETTTAVLTDGHDVAAYETLFGELEKLAIFGAASRQTLDQVTADYQSIL